MFFLFVLFFIVFCSIKKFLKRVFMCPGFSYFDCSLATFKKADFTFFFILAISFVLLVYVVFKFLVRFFFPFFSIIKRSFFLFSRSARDFVYMKLIDFLFFVFVFFYRVSNFFFWGASFQDPIIKGFLQRGGMTKAEILKEFYLFANDILFSEHYDASSPMSFFSSIGFFDSGKLGQFYSSQFSSMKKLLELQQFIRSYFFFRVIQVLVS